MSDVPKNFLISPRKRFIRGSSIILGIFFLMFWFWNKLNIWEQNTLWIIDNSLSMAVADIHTETWISISRFDLAKQFIDSRSRDISGNQAIITASNWARLELPMTQDESIFHEVIQGITIIKQWGGSSLATPLETIHLIYGDLPNLNIIWITDGEFSDTVSTLSGFVTSPNITIIGVGTPSGWPISEWYNSEWLPKYKESQWQKIISVRDDKKLKDISKLLSANLVLKDSNSSSNESLQKKNIDQLKNASIYLILWFFLVIMGLMFPRYQYLSSQKSWK